MTKIYISIGSNISPDTHIRAAVSALGKAFGQLELSPVYRSPAQGFDGADFLNLAVAAESELSPLEIAQSLHRIERQQGRDRNNPKFSDRTLDLDLLIYGNEVVSDDELEIPRPEIEEYAHVLAPLTDLAADSRHPLSGRTFGEMRAEMQDRDPAQFNALQEVVLQL